MVLRDEAAHRLDSKTDLVRSAQVTAAHENDKHSIPELLHGEERRMYGDSAYHNRKDLLASKVQHAKDFTNGRTRWKGWVDEEATRKNQTESRVRAKVEHVFAVVKRQWGFTKVRYRGLAKNATRAFVALALANLYMTRPRCAGKCARNSAEAVIPVREHRIARVFVEISCDSGFNPPGGPGSMT